MQPDSPPASSRFPLGAILLTAGVLAGCLALGLILFWDRGRNGRAEAGVSSLQLEQIPFDGAQAYEFLKQLSAIGPRPSGSPGMRAQQHLLKAHFEKLGGRVEFQPFRIRHPAGEGIVPLANLIVRWRPDSTQRILLCAHYDTLPFPMMDRENPRGRFVGANDGASGVALLMTLARDMRTFQGKYGIDFVLFDGEEFIFDQSDRFFLGSEFFARAYVKQKPPYQYRWAVLLDMVADADLQIYQERNSMSWKDTRPLVEQIWATAARLGVREFIAESKHEIRDDHLMLHAIANIPACDIIDIDYPAWHTQADTPERCSALSLAKVGWVLQEWLKTVAKE